MHRTGTMSYLLMPADELRKSRVVEDTKASSLNNWMKEKITEFQPKVAETLKDMLVFVYDREFRELKQSPIRRMCCFTIANSVS